ncbi:YjgN family protein [Arsukibacterium sp.]|uniref:YjgN family protein n=1 Tax=Arsukibacterium sp. TaxID=1977258 RepID=UPI002FD887CC
MENTAKTAANTRQCQVEFSGKAGEFFGIWIVNIFLSIITLGIYSAWAKVRTNQYFYGHTRIDGQAFRYLAKPMQILKGRLLALAIFIGFFLLSSASPILAGFVILGFVFLMPLLIVLGMRFKMRMTGYRNVRFDFHGDYADAFITFFLLPILAVISLYLAMPWVLKKMDEYLYDNISFAGNSLTVNTRTASYYAASLLAVASVIAVVIVLGILGAMLFSAGLLAQLSSASFMLTLVIFIGYWLAFALASAIYGAMIRNHIFESCHFENLASFQSNLQVMPFLWLNVTNLLAIIVSLGLAYPWAKIRKAHFLAGVTTVNLSENANQLLDNVQPNTGAFGEEAADLFDIDVSLA